MVGTSRRGLFEPEDFLPLPDDCPVFPALLYVADGDVIRCKIFGTVGLLKELIGAKVIKKYIPD